MKTRSWIKQLKKGMAGLTAAVLMVSGSVYMPAVCVQAKSLSELESELQDLMQEAAQNKKELDAARKEASDQQAYADSLDRQIRNLSEQIRVQDQQLELLDSQISEKEAEVARKEEGIAARRAEEEERYAQLGERLRSLEKSGSFSLVQVLLQQENYVDFLYRNKLMRTIAEEDRELMDEIEQEIEQIHADMAEVEQEKQGLQVQKEQHQRLKEESDTRKGDLDGLYKEARKVLSELNQDVEHLRKEQQAIEKQQKELDELISSIKYEDGKYQDGTMLWPVPVVKYLGSPFGMRDGKLHKGIDISGHPTILVHGQDIIAAADGTVVYENHDDQRTGAAKGGGYGYMIILDHGSNSKGVNIRTLYGHCSKLLVREGQKVKAGDVIAKVGDTGNSFGSHLHFEVRENNVPVDPIGKGYVSMK